MFSGQQSERASQSDNAPIVTWAPVSHPQRALVACNVFEVFFGGARGGGKTDGVLGEWATHADAYGSNAVGLMVRRTAKQLGETFERARAIYGPLGAHLVGSAEGGSMRVTMPNGARLIFAHLERDADAENHQGASYTRVYVEEAGNFPSPAPILRLMATLRSGAGVPCRIRLTGNPGGPGHHWLKARYIDPASYIANLRQSGSPELEGDWSVIAGAFFPEWGPQHVVAPFTPPEHWLRFRSMDWGSARPFAVGWWAQADGSSHGLPKGALVKYREWYGSTGEPNVGLRLTAEEVADGIKQRDGSETLAYGVADPAIFSSDGGPSIAERMFGRGVQWRRADNARVSRQGALGGWDAFRQRLKGEDGRPMAYWMATCRDAIRTIPAMQHDSDRPEDMDTEGEDHVADADRYAFVSRPWMPVVEDKPPPLPPGGIRVMDLTGGTRRRERL